MIDILLDPSPWFRAAFIVALGAALALAHNRSRLPTTRGFVMAAMNRTYGCLIGVVALGHVVALAIKMGAGTLSPSTSAFAIPLGFAFGVPAWWLAIAARRFGEGTRTSLVLNLSVAAVFVALVTSAPLAIPAVLNVVYQRHSRPAVGAVAVSLAAAGYLAMVIASFFTSGAP
jgi:hypothetical protein